MSLIASALCMIRQSNQANSATTQILIRDTPLVSILVAVFCGSVLDPSPYASGLSTYHRHTRMTITVYSAYFF